jgi:hypothetical protein
MKSARHQFILVGFLCQGMAWETPFYWIVAVVLWFLALGPLQKRIKAGPKTELAALIGGSALGILCGKLMGQSSHFFLGDGVLFLQLTRMLRPLSRREKLASVLMACFHFAVACTLAPDIRFLLLGLSALILFPKSLIELQSEEFSEIPNSRLEWTSLVPLALIAMAIFVAAPRFSFGTPLRMGGPPMQGGGLLSSVLDPASGGYANSSQVLMQVEGKKLGYFKAMALSQFDGREWRVDEHLTLRPFQRQLSDADLESFPGRRVRVKNVHFLGKVLPTDGRPVVVRGKFFQKPLMNSQGVVECVSSWNSANNQYEYWIDPNPPVESLSPPLIRYYTQHPPASPRVNEFLQRVAEGATNQMDVARRIESHLQKNYTYRIGAPALKRVDALDDFLFDKREGHCERFASALALLLRMHNIPTRIAIGYVPGPQSRFSEWRQVRFKDAHAWTEAWFPEEGWKSFDATPGGGGGEDGYGLTHFIESLDLVWYSHVITFDGSSQREILTQAMGALGELPGFARRNAGIFLGILGLGFAPWLWRLARASGGFRASGARPRQGVDHFYARMLRILEKRGYEMPLDRTPLEFLGDLERASIPCIEEIREITRRFCESRYGEQEITVAEAQLLEKELAGLEDNFKSSRNHRESPKNKG